MDHLGLVSIDTATAGLHIQNEGSSMNSREQLECTVQTINVMANIDI